VETTHESLTDRRSSLIGRQEELEQIRRLVLDPRVRLLISW
jgi:hypothetical protein